LEPGDRVETFDESEARDGEGEYFIGNHPDRSLVDSAPGESSSRLSRRLALKTDGRRLRIVSEVFRAMGRPTRLGIIELLQEREMCVSEIAGHLGANVTSVSKNLSFLRRIGIVRDRKVGVMTYFICAMPELCAFFGCVEGHVGQRIADCHAISQGPEDLPDLEEWNILDRLPEEEQTRFQSKIEFFK
jgi:DNA-binding transcriptional ArsR family regulator